ncbi:hypothetical protein ACP70R_041261 [Stipagrostis hirtigluma subsp. patula]
MSTSAPNAFSNHLAQWVYKESIASVVLVQFLPKDIDGIKALMKAVEPNLPRNQPKEVIDQIKAKREIDSQGVKCSTGFIVDALLEANENHVKVLTCAHPLDHVFNRKEETKFRQGQDERQFVQAIVTHTDSVKDLMVLRVERAQLRDCCRAPHRPLVLARSFPEPLEEVVVLSWPPYRPRTACKGETSHRGREYGEIFVDNPKTYTMRLSEVSILADAGSSGAPLLNGAREVAGVLHGGSQSSLCYFISLRDLKEILKNWGLIN